MRIETVTRVVNYNTFRTKSRKHSVRIASLTEELGVRAAKKATERLKKLISGKKVGISTIGRDVYGRSIARVSINGKSVNLIMNRYLRNK